MAFNKGAFVSSAIEAGGSEFAALGSMASQYGISPQEAYERITRVEDQGAGKSAFFDPFFQAAYTGQLGQSLWQLANRAWQPRTSLVDVYKATLPIIAGSFAAGAGGATEGVAGGAAGGTGITTAGAASGSLAPGFFASEGVAAPAAAAGSGSAAGLGGAAGTGLTVAGTGGFGAGPSAAPAGADLFAASASSLGSGISPSFASGSLSPGFFGAEASAGGSAAFGGVGGGTGGTGMTDLEKWLEMMGLGKPGGGKLGGAMSIGSGIYGMMQARDLKKMAEEAMRDPLAGQRQQYAGELSALRADPSRLTSLPGYKAGEQAVQRSMASQGYLGSGNMMVALQDYGGRIYDAEVQRLSDLAGFGFNPKAGVGAGVSGAASAADLASRSLASLGYGARSFF